MVQTTVSHSNTTKAITHEITHLPCNLRSVFKWRSKKCKIHCNMDLKQGLFISLSPFPLLSLIFCFLVKSLLLLLWNLNTLYRKAGASSHNNVFGAFVCLGTQINFIFLCFLHLLDIKKREDTLSNSVPYNISSRNLFFQLWVLLGYECIKYLLMYWMGKLLLLFFLPALS